MAFKQIEETLHLFTFEDARTILVIQKAVSEAIESMKNMYPKTKIESY